MNIKYIPAFLLIMLFGVFGTAYGDIPDAYTRLTAEGEVFFQKGDFQNAVQAWEEAISLPNAPKNPGAYLDTLMSLSHACQSLGFHQKAMSVLDNGLPFAEKSTDRYRTALYLNSLADLHFSMGNFETAVKHLEKALAEARVAENPHVLASVLNNVGNMLALDEDYAGSLDAYQECLELTENAKPPLHDLQSKTLVNQVRVAFLKGGEQQASPMLSEVIQKLKRLPDSHHKASDLISLSLIISAFKPENAGLKPQKLISYRHELLREAKRITESLKDTRILSCVYGYTGQLYETEKRYPEALQLTRKALFLSRQDHSPEISYRWQWQLARLFKAGGDIEGSLKAYREAIETLDPIRSELFKEYRNSQDTFNQSVKPVYLGLAEIYLEQAEASENKEARQEKLKQAMAIMERLKAAELQDFFEDECVASDQEEAAPPDHTPPHTAVLYPVSLPKYIALLLTTPERIRYIKIPADSENVGQAAKEFRRQLQTRSSYRYLQNARILYDWLIRPIDAELKDRDIRTLIVAPDGALRLIPFSALHDGEHFLIEKYAIGTVPGITLTDSESFGQERPDVLLSGLSEAVQGFPALPGVKTELRDIRQITNAGAVLENKDYTFDNLMQAFKNHTYSVLHLATHGVFGGSSDKSFLLTYDGRLTMDRLEQLIWLGRFREQQADLLTLSACQTAIGDERAALGLAGVAVKAGVKSAVATLWYIDDEATSLAIREFYRELEISGVKVQAMQNAQKKMIARPRYQHPIYWAPFLVIGN
jgi:CHAT domain-containing protein